MGTAIAVTVGALLAICLWLFWPRKAKDTSTPPKPRPRVLSHVRRIFKK